MWLGASMQPNLEGSDSLASATSTEGPDSPPSLMIYCNLLSALAVLAVFNGSTSRLEP